MRSTLSVSLLAMTRSSKRPGISVKLSALHPRLRAAVGVDRVLKELAPKFAGAGAARKTSRAEFHSRRRRGRSAGAVARCCRRGDCAMPRSPDGMASVWRCRPIRNAPGRSDRLDCSGAAETPEPPADGPPRQRRLLGHRGQARAGARARRLPGVYAQGDDRSFCYLDCVRKLLAARPRLYPQFATHNALTVACVIEDAGGTGGYEFQRLHGMGEALYEALARRSAGSDVPCLRAGRRLLRSARLSLVRRLLENGANSSFVSVAADPADAGRNHSAAAAELDRRCVACAAFAYSTATRFVWRRRGAIQSASEFGDPASLAAAAGWKFVSAPQAPNAKRAASMALRSAGRERPVNSPIDGTAIGAVQEGDEAHCHCVGTRRGRGRFSRRGTGHVACGASGARTRRRSDRAESRPADRAPAKRGGKTIDDCVSEVREAADYCRYYAREARRDACIKAAAGSDWARATSCACAAAACFDLHQPVEFSAGDFHRAELRVHSPRATASSRSLPSRRRSLPSRQ